jgi:hypothetical protein
VRPPLKREDNSGAAPATVGGESFSDVPLGLQCKTWEGGEGRRPASQETCLNDVILPACGVRARGGFPLWWQTLLSRARGLPNGWAGTDSI